MQTHGKHLQ